MRTLFLFAYFFLCPLEYVFLSIYECHATIKNENKKLKFEWNCMYFKCLKCFYKKKAPICVFFLLVMTIGN